MKTPTKKEDSKSNGGATVKRGPTTNDKKKINEKKKELKRLWLPWEFCKFIEPQDGDPLPPFGQAKPSSVSPEEKKEILAQSETLFPVGYYDMTPAKRGVTKGRGDWKGKEALRLAHCSAEKNGCRFKARFCRVAHGMEIFTSGAHDITAHLTPRKRGLAPAARAIVTKYKEESQTKLVEWLKDGGLLDNSNGDMEKVKQQIKRRKMTLKRKQKRLAGSSDSEEEKPDSITSGESVESFEQMEVMEEKEQYDDPLYSAKINMLQDDSFVSLIDPPAENERRHPSITDPYLSGEDRYHSGEEEEEEEEDECFHDGVASFNPFADSGPYSPTTVTTVMLDDSPFPSMLESTGPLLDPSDLFPSRTSHSHEFPMSYHQTDKRPSHFEDEPFSSGMDPSGTYYFEEAEV